LDTWIIFKIWHSTWVYNMVHVRKKSGEIWICIDLWNLSRSSDKDNYLVPPMERIIQLISGSELFSLLDRF
jgi:hypothetical protein